MDILMKDLEKAIEHKLYLAALNIALTIPDICSALQSSNGKTDGTKYKNWFNTYCGDFYNNFIDGNDIYEIRCSILHQGKSSHDNTSRRHKRILFQIPTPTNIVLHNNIINDAYNVNIEVFIGDIIKGFNKWYSQEKENINVIKNLEKTVKYYPQGISPYIVGVPLIS